MHRLPLRDRSRQRGAAILLAMLIMTLVATLAAGMIWMQWRGIEVESAERARGEGDWLLTGALDWARLILRSDTNKNRDDLGEPWAVPLAESRLSSFLSADGNHTDDSGPDAFLSGQITDASSKYNFYNLYTDQSPNQDEDTYFAKLCSAVGVPASVAQTISANLRQSYTAVTQLGGGQTGSAQKDTTNSYLVPTRVEDLAWYGIDPATIKQLEPYVIFLGYANKVNVNTAPAEVLMAAMTGLTRPQAQLIVQKRQSSPFSSTSAVQALVPDSDISRITITSDFYEVYGQLRYEQHILRQRTLVNRTGKNVVAIRTERLPPNDP